MVEPHGAEHTHSTGPGDRGGHLLRGGEDEDRILDVEALAELGVHHFLSECLECTSSAGRCSVCSLAHL